MFIRKLKNSKSNSTKKLLKSYG